VPLAEPATHTATSTATAPAATDLALRLRRAPLGMDRRAGEAAG